MHQSVRDQDLTAAEHLDAEWRLFQAFEAGAIGAPLPNLGNGPTGGRRRAQHVDRRSGHPGRLPPGRRAGAAALLRRRDRDPWSWMSELRPRGVSRFASGVGGRCRQLQDDSPANHGCPERHQPDRRGWHGPRPERPEGLRKRAAPRPACAHPSRHTALRVRLEPRRPLSEGSTSPACVPSRSAAHGFPRESSALQRGHRGRLEGGVEPSSKGVWRPLLTYA